MRKQKERNRRYIRGWGAIKHVYVSPHSKRLTPFPVDTFTFSVRLESGEAANRSTKAPPLFLFAALFF